MNQFSIGKLKTFKEFISYLSPKDKTYIQTVKSMLKATLQNWEEVC